MAMKAETEDKEVEMERVVVPRAELVDLAGSGEAVEEAVEDTEMEVVVAVDLVVVLEVEEARLDEDTTVVSVEVPDRKAVLVVALLEMAQKEKVPTEDAEQGAVVQVVAVVEDLDT